MKQSIAREVKRRRLEDEPPIPPPTPPPAPPPPPPAPPPPAPPAAGDSGLLIFDLADPLHPLQVGQYSDVCRIQGLILH